MPSAKAAVCFLACLLTKTRTALHHDIAAAAPGGSKALWGWDLFMHGPLRAPISATKTAAFAPCVHGLPNITLIAAGIALALSMHALAAAIVCPDWQMHMHGQLSWRGGFVCWATDPHISLQAAELSKQNGDLDAEIGDLQGSVARLEDRKRRLSR